MCALYFVSMVSTCLLHVYLWQQIEVNENVGVNEDRYLHFTFNQLWITVILYVAYRQCRAKVVLRGRESGLFRDLAAVINSVYTFL